jgi:hypothetical protein
VTQLGVESSTRPRPATDTPAEAVAAVVDNVAALARAELRLAAMEAKAFMTRVGLGLVMLWLSLLLAQVFVLLAALSPVLLQDQRWTTVALTLLLSLVPTLVVSVLAVRELRRLKDLGHETNGNDKL